MKVSTSVLAATVLALSPLVPASAATSPAAEAAASTKLADTQAGLRDLWLGHVFWVRNVVSARISGNANAAKAAEQQVVANARAIAAVIEPFYGEAASDQLFNLLAGHWGAISDYLDATHAGKKSEQDAAYKRLVENANQIATFLSGANPYLPAATLSGLLTAHGAHHVQQIQQIKARQYDREAQTWAAMKDHMYVIADALAGGIAKQFPDRFR